MYDVRITAVRKVCHRDLMDLYENPIEHTCDIEEGQVFISVGGQRPEGLCESAWGSMEYFVRELANGGGNFFDGWMKDPRSAMISCNDGFRPVSFYLEAIVDRFFSEVVRGLGPPDGPAALCSDTEERLDVGPEQVPDKDDVDDGPHQSDGEHQDSTDDLDDPEDEREVPDELPSLPESVPDDQADYA